MISGFWTVSLLAAAGVTQAFPHTYDSGLTFDPRLVSRDLYFNDDYDTLLLARQILERRNDLWRRYDYDSNAALGTDDLSKRDGLYARTGKGQSLWQSWTGKKPGGDKSPGNGAAGEAAKEEPPRIDLDKIHQEEANKPELTAFPDPNNYRSGVKSDT